MNTFYYSLTLLRIKYDSKDHYQKGFDINFEYFQIFDLPKIKKDQF